jgi:hypothetical protein
MPRKDPPRKRKGQDEKGPNKKKARVDLPPPKVGDVVLAQPPEVQHYLRCRIERIEEGRAFVVPLRGGKEFVPTFFQPYFGEIEEVFWMAKSPSMGRSQQKKSELRIDLAGLTPEIGKSWGKFFEQVPPEMLSDHQQRLFERLSANGLQFDAVDGDGNCQYAAVVKQLNKQRGDKAQLDHYTVRTLVADWLREHELWNPSGGEFTHLFNYAEVNDGEDWDDFCTRMATNAEWGNHVTLMAMAEIFQVEIFVVSSVQSEDGGVYSVCPTQPMTQITLAHRLERHYNGVAPSTVPAWPVALKCAKTLGGDSDFGYLREKGIQTLVICGKRGCFMLTTPGFFEFSGSSKKLCSSVPPDSERLIGSR